MCCVVKAGVKPVQQTVRNMTARWRWFVLITLMNNPDLQVLRTPYLNLVADRKAHVKNNLTSVKQMLANLAVSDVIANPYKLSQYVAGAPVVTMPAKVNEEFLSVKL
jgi:hypothetical protein